MKILIQILVAILFSINGTSQASKDFLFVGNVNCQPKSIYLKTAQKAYRVSYDFNLISQSHNLVDITLGQTGFPFVQKVFARFYFDTTFKLYYVTYNIQENGDFDEGDTTYPPSTLSLDTLFTKVVENGLFNLPVVSTDSIRKSWKAKYISKKKGEFGENTISVADGSQYVLTYKLQSCYGQYIFDNPGTYARFYIDNDIFRRQDLLVKQIMSGYK